MPCQRLAPWAVFARFGGDRRACLPQWSRQAARRGAPTAGTTDGPTLLSLEVAVAGCASFTGGARLRQRQRDGSRLRRIAAAGAVILPGRLGAADAVHVVVSATALRRSQSGLRRRIRSCCPDAPR